MAAAGELEGPRFTPGDLRRTVETRLAAAGYSEEVRGHVQSHSLSGAQKQHYNKYEYDAEKRGAIAALYELLIGQGPQSPSFVRGPPLRTADLREGQSR